MTLRFKKDPSKEFAADSLFISNAAEVLTDDDSSFVSELECYVTAKKQWQCMAQAFKAGDVIMDKYLSVFYEPITEEERRLGYRE